MIIMAKRVNIDKDELTQKYIVEGLSQQQCAEYFRCSLTTIQKRFEMYNIKTRDYHYKASKIDFVPTREQMEILNGALLGDGCIHMNKTNINACFKYESTSFQHVKNLEKYFVGTEIYAETRKNIRKRYNKDETFISYTFKTKAAAFFTELYKKWYPNNKKHIPDDLILTPLTCLIWYLDDGTLVNSKTTYQEISFATNSFDKNEINNILVPQLSDFNAVIGSCYRLNKVGIEEWRIRIPEKEKIKDFLNYIGPCPFDDYSHKWMVKERIILDWRPFYDKWEQLYKNGMTQKEIAELYGCDKSNVHYFLKTRNLIIEHGYKQFYSEWEEKYLDGKTFSELAREYGCSRNAIEKHIWKVFGKNKDRKEPIHDVTAQ